MTRDILFMADKVIREIGDTDRELRLAWQPVDVSRDAEGYENSIHEKWGGMLARIDLPLPSLLLRATAVAAACEQRVT